MLDKYKARFPPNLVRNQKYNVISFLPLVLYEQFKFFFNTYFLLVALSQIVPALRIGQLDLVCFHTSLAEAITRRLPGYLHRTSSICTSSHDRQRGLRRLQALPTGLRSQLDSVPDFRRYRLARQQRLAPHLLFTFPSD